MAAAIISTGIEQPTNTITPKEQFRAVAAYYGIGDDIIERMTGVIRRYRADPGIKPSALAISAAQKALASAGITPAHITTIIYTGVYHDGDEPSTVTRVAHALGLEAHCERYDLRNACHGTTDALHLAKSLIMAKTASYVLICSGELGTRQGDLTRKHLLKKGINRDTLPAHFAAFTLGDMGGALIVGPAGLSGLSARIIGREYRADSSQYEQCYVRNVARQPLMTQSQQLERRITPLARAAIFKLLLDHKMDDSDIDHMIIHQTGKSAVIAHRKLLRIRDGALIPHYPITGNLITLPLVFELNRIWDCINGKKIVASIQGGGIVASSTLLEGELN